MSDVLHFSTSPQGCIQAHTTVRARGGGSVACIPRHDEGSARRALLLAADDICAGCRRGGKQTT